MRSWLGVQDDVLSASVNGHVFVVSKKTCFVGRFRRNAKKKKQCSKREPFTICRSI